MYIYILYTLYLNKYVNIYQWVVWDCKCIDICRYIYISISIYIYIRSAEILRVQIFVRRDRNFSITHYYDLMFITKESRIYYIYIST